MNWKTTAAATAIGLGILGVAAYAHGPQGAYGYGMGSGYGAMHAYGMGPGMMGGYGYGMHGWSGPGYGMGPGMMGGDGSLGVIERLDLTDGQRQQLRKIEDDLRKTNWALMGQMQDEMAKTRDAWSTQGVDRNAVLAANKRMFELRQRMLENRLDAQGKAEALLTPAQKEQYDKLASAWDDDD